MFKFRIISTILMVFVVVGFSSPRASAQWGGWEPPTCPAGQYFDWYSGGCIPLPNLPPSTGSPETIVFVGTPKATPGQLKGYSLSTADIDSILSNVSGMETDYTSQLADEAFNDYENLKTDLVNNLRQGILDAEEITSISTFNIEANPINLRIIQADTSLITSVRGLSADARVNFRVCKIICLTGVGDVQLDNIEITTKLNAFTGQVSDSEIAYDSNVSVNINDTLGYVLFGLFWEVIKELINIDSIAESALRSLTDDVAQQADVQEFFSVREFLLGLRDYSDDIEATVNQFPQSVTLTPSDLSPLLNGAPTLTVTSPVGQNDISDLIDGVIDEGVSIVDGFGGTSVQLDITVKSGAEDNTDNMISFVVSHAAPEITRAQLTIFGTLEIGLDIPAYTQSIRYYSGTGIEFFPDGNPVTSSLYNFPSDGAIIAVGKSGLVSGLYSLPSNIKGVSFPDLQDF